MALRIVIDHPADSLDGKDIYIGPTAVDFSPIDEKARIADQLRIEQKILSSYRHHDHRGYRANRSVRSF